MALRRRQDGGTFLHESLSGALTSMSRQYNSRQFGLIAALTAAAIVLPAWPAAARGPENISDVAEPVIDAVVC